MRCRLPLAAALFAAGASAGPTPPERLPFRPRAVPPLARRAGAASTADQLLTCGFVDGDAARPRTAQPGYDCRVDTAHGLWGFCPSTVVHATDCGLAAACKDSGTCSSVCQFHSDASLTTFTCASSGSNIQYCSTAILTFGVDQSYGYLACGNQPETEHLFITATTTTSSSSSAAKTTASTAPRTTSPTAPRTASTAAPTTTPTPASTADSSSSSSSTAVAAKPAASSNIGAIVGGVLGGLALVCASALAAVYIVKKHNAGAAARSAAAAGPPPPPPGPDYYEYAPAAAGALASSTTTTTGPKHHSLYEADSASSAKFGYTPPPPAAQGYGQGYGYAVELPSHGA